MMMNIGEVAGKIWKYLDTNGETTLANLKKELELKSEHASLSIGWLARENKISMEKKGNSLKISLK